jgi:hypothetical protein
MKKNTLIWIGVYAVVAYGAYYMYFSKDAYAKAIVKAGKYSGSAEALKAFGMNFLRPWARAAKANQPTFTFEGKTFNTQGGKAVK